MSIQKHLGIVGVIVSFILASAAWSDSLWNEKSSSLYSTYRSLKIGDVVTVLVMENTSAISKAGTDTKASDTLSTQFTNNLGALTRYLGTGTRNLAGEFSNRYEGTGKTVRSSTVVAKVASRVTEILPNGNLRIEGFHSVAVNDEVQTVSVTGVIRSKDVTQQNTIQSWQVADAAVKVIGTGIVAEAEQPGWFTRILNWIF